jgi:hypothetical protein
MRKNPTYKEQVYDGIHVNVALSAIYLAAFASGFKFVCLGSFISIIINSAHIWTMWDKAFASEVDEYDSLNSSMESEESEESEELDYDNLSLKQREHGATVAKPMDEEDEIILNSRFQEVVEETRRRNEKRLAGKLPRTPTNTSLSELDEYDDMPPLISSSEIKNNNIAYCTSCILKHNTLNKTDNDNTMNPYISTFREIITASRTTVLHGMDEVD